MKRIILFSILICLSVISYGQKIEQIKGLRTELNGKLNVIDGVPATNYFMSSDTTEARLAKKANLYQPALVNPTANTLPVGTNTTGLATTGFLYKNAEFTVPNASFISQINHTGTTAETTIYTGTIKAEYITAGCLLKFNLIHTMNSNTNAKSYRIKLNGVVCGGATYAAAATNIKSEFCIYWRSKTNFICMNGIGTSSGSYGSTTSNTMTNDSSVDANSDVTVTITATLTTSASDNLAFEFLKTTIIP